MPDESSTSTRFALLEKDNDRHDLLIIRLVDAQNTVKEVLIRHEAKAERINEKLKEVEVLLQDLKDDIAGKINSTRDDLIDSLTKISDSSTKTESRVTKLEKFKWIFMGGIFIIGIILEPVLGHISDKLFALFK